MCKPHKMGWAPKKKEKERLLLKDFEKILKGLREKGVML